MKKNNIVKKTLIITSLSLALAAGLVIATHSGAYAGIPDWEISFDKTSGNSALGIGGKTQAEVVESFRAMQGLGFDTYSGEDGYVFMGNDKELKYSLARFTMEDSGFCIKQKAVEYKGVNVGHANDATVYRDENGKKWLIVAVYGSFEESLDVKDSNGNSIELAAIDLAEYDKGIARVYGCDVSGVVNGAYGDGINGANITGISYKGKDLIDGQVRPVFLIMKASAVFEAYLTGEGDQMKFTATGRSGRIIKPTLLSGGEASTQGIVYHNNYFYITGEGKNGKGEATTEMVVARISLESLFDGDPSSEKYMEAYKDDMSSSTVTKHGPEGAFFTKLNEKSHLYIGVNRVLNGKDDDCIMRTPMRF